MSGPEHITDDALLTELRQALQPGPADHVVAEVAKAGFGFRTMDEELWLATLDYDEILADSSSVRAGGNYTLTFRSDTALVEIEAVGRDLVGQVVPPIDGELTAEFADGIVLPVEMDELGCFTVQVGSGPVRLQLVGFEGRMTTEWVSFD